MNTERIPTESAEQQWLFKWAAYESSTHPELGLMYHIPNEGQRSRATGGRMRAEGLKKGVPDICLPVARMGFHGLYIELKRIKHGRVTEEQRTWLRKLTAEGYLACICHGWRAAARVITDYLNGKPTAETRT